MKIIRVQYTTNPEYVAKNKVNIEKVMSDLREINNPGIKYATYLLPDEKTFMHFSQFDSDESHQVLLTLESLIIFQNELKASGLDVPPKSKNLSLVASCYAFFC
jgi:hypothetical protein